MKHLRNRLSIGMALAIALFSAACQKESDEQSPENQTNNVSAARTGKIVEDDASVVSKVPMIMSTSLATNGVAATTGIEIANAKPVKPGGGGGGGTTDLISPTVSITSPANGATVSSVVTITVSASDNVGVASVSLSVNGNIIGTRTSAPYNFSWDASTAAAGTHTITATARDAKNNGATSTITVAKNTVIVPPPTGTLPSSFFLSTPPVGDQGFQEQTCTPFASVYAARSIEQFYRTGAGSYSPAQNIFSVEYVYNQAKSNSDCNSGTSITQTLELMKTKGVCTAQSMPYTDGDCYTMPNSVQNAEAANYRIGGYSKLANNDVVGIKTMVSQKHPVIVSIVMDNSFINAGPGFIWKAYSGSGSLPHCLIICGYDDSKNAYKVMSSWGTAWGEGGYSWIDYNFLPSKSGYYVYTMNY